MSAPSKEIENVDAAIRRLMQESFEAGRNEGRERAADAVTKAIADARKEGYDAGFKARTRQEMLKEAVSRGMISPEKYLDLSRPVTSEETAPAEDHPDPHIGVEQLEKALDRALKRIRNLDMSVGRAHDILQRLEFGQKGEVAGYQEQNKRIEALEYRVSETRMRTIENNLAQLMGFGDAQSQKQREG